MPESICVDDRGIIQKILSAEDMGDLRSILRIESKKDTIRAQHWHKSDWHYCYVEYGSIGYAWRELGSRLEPWRQIFTRGQMFYTGKEIEHAMFFLEDTAFFVFSGNRRTKNDYESNTIRLEVPLTWK